MRGNSFKWEECHGRVSEERISYIQSCLLIKLPEMYIELVKACDGGIPIKTDFEYFDLDFQEIWGTGIGSFLPLNPSKYGDMLANHLSPPEFFPEGLIAFAGTGGGDYICFDYRQGKDNPDPPIVYWNHEADIGKDVSFVAHNFEEFLGMLKEPED